VRLVKKAEAAFNVMPQEIPTYDHYTPAAWLLGNPSALDGTDAGIIATLDRTESLY